MSYLLNLVTYMTCNIVLTTVNFLCYPEHFTFLEIKGFIISVKIQYIVESIYLSLHHVPKDVGSMNKISLSIPILSIPISLEEGVASNDIIFPSLPWSPLSLGTRDHLHKNAFGKKHVAHSANMTKPGQL